MSGIFIFTAHFASSAKCEDDYKRNKCLSRSHFNLKPEPSSSHGRADLIIDTPQVVYVLEFKVVELEGDGIKAIHQIKDRGYHQQYVQAGRKVILIGMDFSRAERNLVGFEWEASGE